MTTMLFDSGEIEQSFANYLKSDAFKDILFSNPVPIKVNCKANHFAQVLYSPEVLEDLKTWDIDFKPSEFQVAIEDMKDQILRGLGVPKQIFYATIPLVLAPIKRPLINQFLNFITRNKHEKTTFGIAKKAL